MLWRLRRRSVRLASAQHSSSPPAGAPPGRLPDDAAPAVLLDVPRREAGDAAVGHVLAVWRELTDTAWDYGIEPDEALTPRRAAARIVRIGELDETVGRSVHRVAGAVEQVLFAPEPRAEAGLADDVRKVRAALRERVGWTTRVRAVVAPRSAIRAVWDLTDRWTALRASWTVRLAALVRRPSGHQQSG